jgi:hypothetical protein
VAVIRFLIHVLTDGVVIGCDSIAMSSMGQFLILFPSAEKSNSKQRHCRLHRCVDVFSPRLSLIHGKNKLAMMTADEMSKLKKALAIARVEQNPVVSLTLFLDRGVYRKNTGAI